MNAEEFYDEFKAALDFLGLRWGDKDKATIWVRDGYLVLSVPGREASIQLKAPTRGK